MFFVFFSSQSQPQNNLYWKPFWNIFCLFDLKYIFCVSLVIQLEEFPSEVMAAQCLVDFIAVCIL